MYSLSMSTNPQSGSASGSSSAGDETRMKSKGLLGQQKALPPLFWYMETGEWAKATERAKRHPREVKTWASLRTKSTEPTANGDSKISGAKRLALHHACFKLRSTVSCDGGGGATSTGFGGGSPSAAAADDPFVEVCKFILLILEIYPEAASQRESRHGCLPIHLAAFASCTRNSQPDEMIPAISPASTAYSLCSLSSNLPSPANNLAKPPFITNRSASESTTDTMYTNISAVLAEEHYTGTQSMKQATGPSRKHRRSSSSSSPIVVERGSSYLPSPTVSVSMSSNILISAKREDWAVRVLNALLDAYPRGIRMDSEGGRLPLHTACAGRATPRVISTLVTANPSAARHRNKDGFLPLHLAAHWGISHPNVGVILLKAYPDATFGRNRWERTPLEEALSMAGENGRPHQSSLVRALRKHPSYWTRPADVFADKSPREGSQIVDIDATLPSNDESTEGDDHLGHGKAEELVGEQPSGFKGRLGIFRKNRNSGEGVEAAFSPVSADLVTLIRNQNWNSVLARLECNPHEAEEELSVTTRGGFTSSQGFLALHYACERRPPVEVVEALIAVCPGAVSTRSMPGGCLPLHIACTWYAPPGAVSSLLMADRTTCKVQDELGNVALHSACFSGTSSQVVESLLRAYPKAALSRNHQGSLPEDICKRLRHENRRSLMALLNLCKDEVLARKHDRSKSSEAMSNIAKSAVSLNERDGPPLTPQSGVDEVYDLIEPSTGVEVSYDGPDNEELVWI